MERYTVSVVSEGSQPASLLLPFRATATVSEFIVVLSRRLSKQGFSVNATDIQLHLGMSNGPLLDEEDLLEHVVISPGTEILHATFSAKTNEATVASTTIDTSLSWRVRSTSQLNH
jgi:hypothetical protein